MIKKSVMAAFTLATALMLSYSAGASDKLIPTWDGNEEELFQTRIVIEGLKQLGYQIDDIQQTQVPLAHVAVGNGDATFFAADWNPLQDAYMKQAGGAAKLVRVGTLTRNCLQGYLIDKKTADTYGIKSIDQLKDPKLAALFDIDGDGKADLYGCNPGWGCERVIDHQLKAYGLSATVVQKQGDYFAIIADAIQRIKEGKPTLYYTYTPLWLSSVLQPGHQVTWLTVPFSSLPDDAKDNTNVPGLGNLGFPVNTQHVVANVAFLNANPKAKKFFEEVEVPVTDINAENMKIHNGEKTDADIGRHVEDWIKANQTKWDKWITDAKAAQ